MIRFGGRRALICLLCAARFYRLGLAGAAATPALAEGQRRSATRDRAGEPPWQFVAERPNQKWIADFSYLWAAEGWLYVAAVIDLFSPRVVGWSLRAVMTAQLVTDALLMAVWRRCKPDALLHHSDQGSHGSRTTGSSSARSSLFVLVLFSRSCTAI